MPAEQQPTNITIFCAKLWILFRKIMLIKFIVMTPGRWVIITWKVTHVLGAWMSLAREQERMCIRGMRCWVLCGGISSGFEFENRRLRQKNIHLIDYTGRVCWLESHLFGYSELRLWSMYWPFAIRTHRNKSLFVFCACTVSIQLLNEWMDITNQCILAHLVTSRLSSSSIIFRLLLLHPIFSMLMLFIFIYLYCHFARQPNRILVSYVCSPFSIHEKQKQKIINEISFFGRFWPRLQNERELVADQHGARA